VQAGRRSTAQMRQRSRGVRKGRHHRERCVGALAQDRFERRLAQLEDANVRLREQRSRTRLARDDSHFADEVARPTDRQLLLGGSQHLHLASAMLFERDGRAQSALETMVHATEPSVRATAYRAIASGEAAGAQAFALAGLRDPDPAVRAEAARAVAATAKQEAVEPLVALLADDDTRVRDAAAEALAEVGDSATEAVADALFSDAHEAGALATLHRLPLDGAAARIRRFASESVARALEDARLRRRLGASAEAPVTLLRDSLGARGERHALAALRAAALLGDRSSVSTALESLTVSDPGQRATAIEVIETVGDPAIVRPLLTLWESRADDGFDPEVIDRLCDHSDERIRRCAEFASAALRGGTMTHTLTTPVPLVERVIFLRKVPLFATLPPQDLQPIAAIAEEQVFSEGEMLAIRGEPGDTLYVIVDGECADGEIGIVEHSFDRSDARTRKYAEGGKTNRRIGIREPSRRHHGRTFEVKPLERR
jgi:HEAT repeat protein